MSTTSPTATYDLHQWEHLKATVYILQSRLIVETNTTL